MLRSAVSMMSGDASVELILLLSQSVRHLSKRLRAPLTSVRLRATAVQLKIRSFVHKGFKKLHVDDVAKGVPPDAVDKFRKMLAFLDDMDDPEELRALPSWKTHILTGDRKSTWSLSVTANRRLTFRIDTGEREIYNVNLEDYH